MLNEVSTAVSLLFVLIANHIYFILYLNFQVSSKIKGTFHASQICYFRLPINLRKPHHIYIWFVFPWFSFYKLNQTFFNYQRYMIFLIQCFYFKAQILMPSNLPETGFYDTINSTDQILKFGIEILTSISSHSVFQLLFLVIAASGFRK